MRETELLPLLQNALDKRQPLLQSSETNALRLFNGFYEGCADFSVDLYADTLVILWMSRKEKATPAGSEFLSSAYRGWLPQVQCVLLKERFGSSDEEKKGRLLFGSQPAAEIREWNVPYTIDLRLNKDCSFYLDSSLLRSYLLAHAAGKRVLNTFAYTGSLGLAAAAGGSASVTQTDLNRNYLRLASGKHSQEKVPVEVICGDFFRVTSALRRSSRLFDLVILDPPFFSTTRAGKVDQQQNSLSLINKVRPLTADGGKIIVINNALFLSGKQFLAQLESLCGPCLQIEERIPVPESFFGGSCQSVPLPADPAPFNHPTKIVVLNAMRKDQRS